MNIEPGVEPRHLHLERQGAELRNRLIRLRRDRDHTDRPLEADFAEQAVQCENDEVLDRLEVSVTSELSQIEHALARLNRGLGDDCERCGEPIGRERLAAVPYATQCAACARGAQARPRAVGAARP